MPLETILPPRPAADWHLTMRLSVYPNQSRLQAFTYTFARGKRSTSNQLFTPRIMSVPETDWDVVQSLAYGIDLVSARRWR